MQRTCLYITIAINFTISTVCSLHELCISCVLLQRKTLLEDLDKKTKEQGELHSANESLEGNVAKLDQELQREKVCHAIDYQCAEHINATAVL